MGTVPFSGLVARSRAGSLSGKGDCPLFLACILAALAAVYGRHTLAEEAPNAVSLVGAALEAHGGEAGLGRWTDLSLEADAMISRSGSETPGKYRLYVRGGAMVRREALLTVRGSSLERVEAAAGKTAWERSRSRVYDVPPDDLLAWLRHQPDQLLLAAGKGALGPLAFRGREDLEGDAVDVVEYAEQRGPTRLLLDAKTHLLRGVEYTTTESSGGGRRDEVFVKKVFGDYRPVGGVPFPHRIEEFEKGARQLRLEVRKVALGTPPEPPVFARPAPDEEATDWWDEAAN